MVESLRAYRFREVQPVFPRLDVKKELKELAKILPGDTNKDKASFKEKIRRCEAKVKDGKDDMTEITIDDFAKLDLRVAKVIAAEKVKNADKLLKLQLEVGEETRQVVSGIAQHYSPEQLVGKNVILWQI